MEPILNELAVQPSPGGDHDLDVRVRQLIDVLGALFQLGVMRILRSTRDALERPITAERTFGQWLADRRTLREEKRLLQAWLGKAPFVDELLVANEPPDVVLEYRFQGRPCLGLGAAHLLEAPAVSFLTDARFAQDTVSVTRLRVDEESNEESEDVHVHHYAAIDHVERRRDELRRGVFREILDGDEIWRRRKELFQRLDFCPQTERQLGELHGRERYFREICRHLYTIDDALVEWTEGELSPGGITWSHESRMTLNHGEYGAARRIQCHDGEVRTFSAHSKLRAANMRIYFFPLHATRRALIGYIGRHLPTVDHPT